MSHPIKQWKSGEPEPCVHQYQIIPSHKKNTFFYILPFFSLLVGEPVVNLLFHGHPGWILYGCLVHNSDHVKALRAHLIYKIPDMAGQAGCILLKVFIVAGGFMEWSITQIGRWLFRDITSVSSISARNSASNNLIQRYWGGTNLIFKFKKFL